MNAGLSFLDIEEMVAGTPDDRSTQVGRVSEYVALRSEHPELDSAAVEFLCDVLAAPLDEGSIASWVGVLAPEAWDPVLIRCQLRVTDVSFDDADELIDVALETHAGDRYATELSRLDLPVGQAVRVQQVFEDDDEDVTDAADAAADGDGLLVESLSFYIPVGGVTLALLANCTSVGWLGEWGPWIERLALSLRWEPAQQPGVAVIRRRGDGS